MTPLCACHCEPMYRVGGDRDHWACKVKKRERDRRYLLSDKGRARARRFRVQQSVTRREASIQRLEELIHQ